MIAYSPYRKKKSYTLAIVILLLAVLLSFSVFRNMLGLRSVLLSVLYPFQWTGATVWKGVVGTPGAVIHLRNLSGQNAQLKKELENIKPKLIVLEELSRENDRLRSALSYRQNNQYGSRLLAAEVTGKSPSPWFVILILNQGSKAGVRPGLPVLDRSGLVGRIVEVSAFSSKAMLITDPGSSVAVEVSRSRDYGIVQGGVGNKLIMKYVAAGGEVRAGDRIVTSQISTVYPPGIPVGEVIKASKKEQDLFYHIEIRPAVDFSKIEEVYIKL